MIDWLKPSTAIASDQELSAKKFKQFHDCHIKHNDKRRHVLHETVEQYSGKKEHFDTELTDTIVITLFVNARHVQIHSSSSS